MINNSKYIQTIGKNADPNDNSGLPAWAVERVRQCYEVCAEKNVLPPTLPNLDNLPATISEIRASTGVQSPFVINQGTLQTVSEWSIAPATDVGDMVCYHLFYGFESYSNTSLISADLSSLTQITGYDACSGMFQRCVNLTNAPLTNVKLINNISAAYGMFQYCPVTATGLDNLEEINGNSACDHMYYKCPNLVSTGLHSLRKISGSQACNEMFEDNTALVDIGLENLVEVNNQMGMREMFIGCSSIEVARFTKLKRLNQTRILEMTFKNCTALKHIYFPNLTTIYSNATFGEVGDGMLYGCTDVTVHFLASMQSVIGNWTAVQNGFGGTNTTVLFDLGVNTTITAPLNTVVAIDNTVVFDGTQETESTTVMLSPGEHNVVAANRTTNIAIQYTAEISDENPAITVDFNDFEYGTVTPTSSVSGAIYSATMNNEYGLVITLGLVGGQAFTVNTGNTITVSGTADGYDLLEPVEVEVTGVQTVELEFVQIVSSLTYDVSNFAEVLSPALPTTYWDIGENLTIHPTISTLYNTSKGITFNVPATTKKIRISTRWYVSSEANYDFGFVSLGTELVSPTASDIKNGTIANGEYLYTMSGQNNVMGWSNYETANIVPGDKVLTLGWGQDNSSGKGTNTMYVSEILIEFYE